MAKSISVPFPVLEATRILWPLFSRSAPRHFSSPSSVPQPREGKDPCDHIAPTWIIQDLLRTVDHCSAWQRMKGQMGQATTH